MLVTDSITPCTSTVGLCTSSVAANHSGSAEKPAETTTYNVTANHSGSAEKPAETTTYNVTANHSGSAEKPAETTTYNSHCQPQWLCRETSWDNNLQQSQK